MKLVHHTPDNPHHLTGHGPGFVLVNEEKFTHSLVISPTRLQRHWAPNFASLTADHFTELLQFEPELVIFGSGSIFRFPDPSLSHALMAQSIGMEVMDTAAACRTYAVLASEDRRVVAALLVE
ncbi:MAG: Xcc1710-like domain-containing protein [Ferrovum sp.]|nr:Xcc1710-like domain-containing protein [Ferrovum sp.]NDU87158.1 Xcc1710-like domain-containing protein [Ferrovum sp.]